MRTLFIALRAAIFGTGFIFSMGLGRSQLAPSLRTISLGIGLSDWTRTLGIVLMVVGGTLAFGLRGNLRQLAEKARPHHSIHRATSLPPVRTSTCAIRCISAVSLCSLASVCTNSRSQFCSSLCHGFCPLISLSSCTRSRISTSRLACPTTLIAVRCAAGCPCPNHRNRLCCDRRRSSQCHFRFPFIDQHLCRNVCKPVGRTQPRTIGTDFSSHMCTTCPVMISPDCAFRRTVRAYFEVRVFLRHNQ